ncbi:hypothetical protein SAMN05421853_11769 [Roseivivax halotolerans]|uniref:GpW protein n=1 Tax=Roseivivax halotolerans TaxID=93684 RepID=A0A1I6ACS8_9RHOB|nr:hypothetical protein [Roseivivax halotolerans]SFQ66546.1 hypothetical protein SAMN05421853_11769 [Roseivivax halotolerans]
MADLAVLKARLAKLEELREDGVDTAKFGDDEVRYKSDAQLVAAMADLKGRIAALEGRQIRKVRVTSSKGLS